MTDAGWAEKVARKFQFRIQEHGPEPLVQVTTVAALLKAEHARAIRIVKAEIKRVKLEQYYYRDEEKLLITTALERILTALQRGRGGKG